MHSLPPSSLITWDTPHLIVMDEPTNHLDLETIEALIQAVICFKGACIIVSHDQHFLRNIAKQYW
jgi:ATPase subunit of ABC transporter with duplicated ATPase domains